MWALARDRFGWVYGFPRELWPCCAGWSLSRLDRPAGGTVRPGRLLSGGVAGLFRRPRRRDRDRAGGTRVARTSPTSGNGAT
eukprot:10149393-Lingulodinium_polyedra.AAC.1